jgi:flagellar biosynthetic protein FlhB
VAGDKHSKTEKPSAKRQKDARKKGNIPRSPELVTWTALMVATFLLPALAERVGVLWKQMAFQMSQQISHPDTGSALGFLGRSFSGAAVAVLPFLVPLALVGVVGNLAQTRGALNTSALRPSLKSLDPRKGFQRIFSPKAGWEAAKQLIKVGAVGVLVWRTVTATLTRLTGQGQLDVMAVGGLVVKEALSLGRTVAAIGLLLAIVDYLLARRRVGRGLKMTKQEVRQESKDNDGNPEVKGAIRRRQRQMARRRMLAAVAGADAVVVNPTHYAVALRYEAGSGAPKVVAKGIDFLALRIREEAEAHAVPLVEDVPLARALYAACQLDQEIPTEFYEAVARLLSFIYSLRRSGHLRRHDGQPHRPSSPLLPGP